MRVFELSIEQFLTLIHGENGQVLKYNGRWKFFKREKRKQLRSLYLRKKRRLGNVILGEKMGKSFPRIFTPKLVISPK